MQQLSSKSWMLKIFLQVVMITELRISPFRWVCLSLTSVTHPLPRQIKHS